MGEHADEIVDRYMNRMSRVRKVRTFQSGSGDFMWRRGDGKLVSMWDMDDDYIDNALRICDRTNNTGKAAQLNAVKKRRAMDRQA